MANSYSDAAFRKDLNELTNLLEHYASVKKGGKGGNPHRSFTAETVNGKPYTGNAIRVELGHNESRKTREKPGVAAQRIYRSLCSNLGMKKFNCDITFTIRETTRGSKGKVYGPYEGTTKRLEGAQKAKKEKAYKEGKIKFIPTAVVTVRKVDKPHKGGAHKKRAASKKRSTKRRGGYYH